MPRKVLLSLKDHSWNASGPIRYVWRTTNELRVLLQAEDDVRLMAQAQHFRTQWAAEVVALQPRLKVESEVFARR